MLGNSDCTRSPGGPSTALEQFDAYVCIRGRRSQLRGYHHPSQCLITHTARGLCHTALHQGFLPRSATKVKSDLIIGKRCPKGCDSHGRYDFHN